MTVVHTKLRRVAHELADRGRTATGTVRNRSPLAIAVEAKRVSSYGGP